MFDKKLVDYKNVDLVPSHKQKVSRLKVSWTTHQGRQKKRGNPTIEYHQVR